MPGFARAGELELEGEEPKELVFCIHECHKKPFGDVGR